MSRWVRYRKGRREKGLCGYAGCQEVTEDRSYYCQGHADVRKLKRKSQARPRAEAAR